METKYEDSIPSSVRETTCLKNVVFAYEWIIENFGDFLRRKYEIHSPVFIPDPQDSTVWKLVSYVQESYPQGANLAVSLVKTSNNDRPHGVKYKICIVSGDGCKYAQEKEKIFRERRDFEECALVSHADLIGKKLLKSNNLVLRCEMDIVVTENETNEEMETEFFSRATVASDFNNLSGQVSQAPSKSMPAKNPEKLKNVDISYNIFDNECLFLNSLDEKSSSSPHDDLQSLSDDFRELYTNKNFADITVFAEGIPMCAHKAVLSARSDFFKKICTEKSIKNTITILEVKSTVVEEVLYYLYTGKIRQLTFDFAVDMLSAAKKFRLSHLQQLLIEYLKPNISTVNVKETFQTSIDLKLDDLQQLCLEFNDSNQFKAHGSNRTKPMIKNSPLYR